MFLMIQFSDDLPPHREERPSSPTPAYDEVTQQRPQTLEVDGISPSDVKIDIGTESPPNYAVAIAMSSADQQFCNDQGAETSQVSI